MFRPTPWLGALRTIPHTPSSLLNYRSFSIFRPTITASRTSIYRSAIRPFTRPTFSVYRHPLSILSWFRPSSTPSPDVLANISHLETEANTSPEDLSKQLALFKALVSTGVEAGYDIVITRWERMCEFNPTSSLLRSDEAFGLYLRCLLNTHRILGLQTAIEKRDTLLGSSAPPLNGPASSTVSSETSSPLSGSSLQNKAAQPLSPSQQIAQAIIADQSANPLPRSPSYSSSNATVNSSDLTKLAAALNTGAGINGNPIHVTLSEPKGAWIPRLIRFTLLTVVAGFFILVIFAVLLENSGLLKAGPQQAEFEATQGKTYKFSDVQGVDEAKTELQDVVEFLKDPTAFASLGGKLPKGILLTGSPGTGKTMLARAVAGEAGVPFLFASGSEFDEMFVGVGAKRIRDLFAAARKRQPAIIFIDELDAIGGKRSSRDQHYMKQTLNQLLVEMDGFLQTEGVIVIAATNFPESLDQALVRPGRFDRIIAVPLPDIRGRVQILRHHMRDVITSKDADPKILARGTPGFSGADLQNMVNQAAIQASKEGCKEVNLKHFEWAKDRIVMGAERKSQYIDEKVKRLTAYHEGGHALVALYTDGAMPLHKVTCVPRGHALGVTSQLPENDRLSVTLKEYLADIDVSMGGRVAEELSASITFSSNLGTLTNSASLRFTVYGTENVTSGASSDIRHATSTATAMVKRMGFSDKVGPVYHGREEASGVKRQEIESEIDKIIKEGQARVTVLLKSKEDELHRLAQALIEYETLDSEEVRKVIRGEPIRNIKEILEEAQDEVQTSKL